MTATPPLVKGSDQALSSFGGLVGFRIDLEKHFARLERADWLSGHLDDAAFELGNDYPRRDLPSDSMILMFGTEPCERLWIVPDNNATH